MDCKNALKYFFIYANKTISRKNKDYVEYHIRNCKNCANILDALVKLKPQMETTIERNETMHFVIDFPDINLCYCGIRREIQNFEYLNKILCKNNQILPEDEDCLSVKYEKTFTPLAMFDNEGNEIEFSLEEYDENYMFLKTLYLKKFYNYMWVYYTFSRSPEKYPVTKLKDFKNVYYGSMSVKSNGNLKSALYQAVPEKAQYIKIFRGNGVLRAGNFKFPYSERYITQEESILLDYSFELN